MKLSDTALIVLGNAANREDRMVPRRPKSPPIVDINACRALVKTELLESVALPHIARPDLVTTGKQDDGFMGFRITDAGFRAISQEPPGATPETAATDAPTAPHAATDDTVAQEAAAVADALDAAPVAPTTAAASPRTTKTTLRDAALVVLSAWDDEGNRATDIIGALEAPMEGLRALLVAPAPRAATGAPPKPREGTKTAQVLAMLREPGGTTGAEIQKAMDWNSNTTRGFLSGLRKKGVNIETHRRLADPVEPTRGSVTVYTLPAA